MISANFGSQWIYKPPAWWKTSQTPLLTKMMNFENFEASKTWKRKLCSFCKPLAWWKTTQTSLLTKVRDFESFEADCFKNLKTQAAQSVKNYPKTSFDKLEAFEISEAKTWTCLICSSCKIPFDEKLPKHMFGQN